MLQREAGVQPQPEERDRKGLGQVDVRLRPWGGGFTLSLSVGETGLFTQKQTRRNSAVNSQLASDSRPSVGVSRGQDQGGYRALDPQQTPGVGVGRGLLTCVSKRLALDNRGEFQTHQKYRAERRRWRGLAGPTAGLKPRIAPLP